MIALYQVRTPNSVVGVVTAVGGHLNEQYEARVRVYAYADVVGVGRVISAGYAESNLCHIVADDGYITFTVTPGTPYGNEPHYENTTGYIFVFNDSSSGLSAGCGYNYNGYIINPSVTLAFGRDNPDYCATLTAGTPNQLWQSKLTFSTTPQADIPRQSALSTNAAIEALAFSFIAAFRAYAASGGQVLYGHGNPNGVYIGNVGDLYTDIDTSIIWTKTSGAGTNTGWTT